MSKKIEPLAGITARGALTAAKQVADHVVINPRTGRPCKARTVNRKTVAERYPNMTPEQVETKLKANLANMQKAREAREAALVDPAHRARVTRVGVPDGWTRETYAQHQVEIQEKAAEFVRELTNHEEMDGRARLALEFAMRVVLAEASSVADRMTAARLLLDFCRARPKGSHAVAIRTAEEFLAEVKLTEGAE